MGFQLSSEARRELSVMVDLGVRRIAKKVAADARAASPPGRRGSVRRQQFAATWKVRPSAKGWTVGSTSPNAHIVEFGSRTTPEFAPLRKALAKQRLRVTTAGGPSGKRRGITPRKRKRKRRRPRT